MKQEVFEMGGNVDLACQEQQRDGIGDRIAGFKGLENPDARFYFGNAAVHRFKGSRNFPGRVLTGFVLHERQGKPWIKQELPSSGSRSSTLLFQMQKSRLIARI